jgi:hypothetical protein
MSAGKDRLALTYPGTLMRMRGPSVRYAKNADQAIFNRTILRYTTSDDPSLPAVSYVLHHQSQLRPAVN